jgi:hypothetical protein
MAIKLADTLAPMGDFPAADASDVEITLLDETKKSIQQAYEDGDLGGGGGGDGVQAVEVMPISPANKDVVMYVGNDTEEFKKGNTYQATVGEAWVNKAWAGLTGLEGKYVWTDGTNIYSSMGGLNYVLDKATSTWSPKEWIGFTNINSENIWSDGDNVYYSSDSGRYSYELDKNYAFWTDLTPTSQADQTYNPASPNAQSGIAVKQAIDEAITDVLNTGF